ncbi:hypothetical protein PENSOL_c226G09113, partial [Penicillium solitum]
DNGRGVSRLRGPASTRATSHSSLTTIITGSYGYLTTLTIIATVVTGLSGPLTTIIVITTVATSRSGPLTTVIVTITPRTVTTTSATGRDTST